ncbi:ArgE/DapE family deacylase [Bacillus sp. AK128]
MNRDKEMLNKWINDQKEDMIEFLQKLVQIPSDNPAGDCYPIANFLYQQLESLGFHDVSLVEVDEAEVKKTGMISLASVIANTKFGSGKGSSVTLNAHGDVVPPGLGWSVDPYGGEIINGKMFGRGVAVSKSDIAAYTYAVLALKKNLLSTELDGMIDLAFTFDEEIGGVLGPKGILDQELIKPDLAIVAGFTYSAVNAHNGCLHYEITVTGRSAHAALPETGIDAIEASTSVMNALYEYRKTLQTKQSSVPGINKPSLVIGLISGGINTNVVPDECKLRVDRRLIPEEDAEQAEAEFLELVQETLSKFEGIKVEIKKILDAKSFGPVPKDTPMITTLSNNWKLLMEGEEELPVHGVPLYTDARHFYEKGIPTIMFGVGPKVLEEANGHRADENIRIEDFLLATQIIACTLYDLLVSKDV